MPYESVSLEESIHIRKLYSVHYFQYMSDFSFPGESHNFWEFIYVDSGTVNVTAGRRRLTLNRGNILFHKPNEFHSVHANGVVSPSLVVVSFSCHSACMNAFKGQLLTLQNSEHELLADLIREAQHAFNGRMDDPYLRRRQFTRLWRGAAHLQLPRAAAHSALQAQFHLTASGRRRYPCT